MVVIFFITTTLGIQWYYRSHHLPILSASLNYYKVRQTPFSFLTPGAVIMYNNQEHATFR